MKKWTYEEECEFARTARDFCGEMVVEVETPFHAEWTNPIPKGNGDYWHDVKKVDYAEGDIIRCGSWRPEGFSCCESEGKPLMWLPWRNFVNCRVLNWPREDVA